MAVDEIDAVLQAAISNFERSLAELTRLRDELRQRRPEKDQQEGGAST